VSKITAVLCRWFGHKFDEFHIHEVVCSRCRICREYTEEDEANLQNKKARDWYDYER